MINSEVYAEWQSGLGGEGFEIKIFIGPIEAKMAKNDEVIREQLAVKVAERAFAEVMTYLETLP